MQLTHFINQERALFYLRLLDMSYIIICYDRITEILDIY